MAMMQELIKRSGCIPAVGDPYSCDDRLRNQFVQYHDRTAWYATIYSKYIPGGRAELAASKTLLGVKEVVAAYYAERLNKAAKESPEAFKQAYAAAVASGAEGEEAAHAALEAYVQAGLAVLAAAVLALWDEAFPPSEGTLLVEQESSPEQVAGALLLGAGGSDERSDALIEDVEDRLQGEIRRRAGLRSNLILDEEASDSPLQGQGTQWFTDPETGKRYSVSWTTDANGARRYTGPPFEPKAPPYKGPAGPSADIYEGLDQGPSGDIYEGLDSPSPSPLPPSAPIASTPRPPAFAFPSWQSEAQDALRGARPPDGPPQSFDPPPPPFGPPAPPIAPWDPASQRTRRAIPWTEPERDPFSQALVDFGEYAQGATEELGKDVGRAYGALWDLGFGALQKLDVVGDRESALPWRDAAVGVVERGTEIVSGAIADAATFGATSFGPLTQRFEGIIDDNTRNQDEIGVDDVGRIALDTFNVFNPVEHLRIAAQKGLEAHAAGDHEEVGKRYLDAVVAAAQIVGIGKGIVEKLDAGRISQRLSELRRGKNSGVFVVETATEMRALYEELSQGGTPVTRPGYQGQMVELPDGTLVGFREESKWGGPTIDITPPTGRAKGVHLP